jgi:hypothetical protein
MVSPEATRNLLPLSSVTQLPPSLQPAALSVPLRKLDHADYGGSKHALEGRDGSHKRMYHPYFRGKQYELITIRRWPPFVQSWLR